MLLRRQRTADTARLAIEASFYPKYWYLGLDCHDFWELLCLNAAPDEPRRPEEHGTIHCADHPDTQTAHMRDSPVDKGLSFLNNVSPGRGKGRLAPSHGARTELCSADQSWFVAGSRLRDRDAEHEPCQPTIRIR